MPVDHAHDDSETLVVPINPVGEDPADLVVGLRESDRAGPARKQTAPGEHSLQ